MHVASLWMCEGGGYSVCEGRSKGKGGKGKDSYVHSVCKVYTLYWLLIF